MKPYTMRTSFSLCSVLCFLVLMMGGCATHRGQTDATSADALSKTCNGFSFARYPSAQKYDLVFEGGGAKGTAFVGALQELERRKISGRRMVGTSAGAITATLLAAGYTADEMLAAVNEKTKDGKPRFTTFMDIPDEASFTFDDVRSSVTYDVFHSVDMPLLKDRLEKKLDDHIFGRLMTHDDYRVLFSFVERGGLYEGKKFVQWMEEKLDADCRNLGKATMQDFYRATGNDLTVVASDVTKHKKLILNRTTAPNLPVAYAVRMSMSIPFVWQEVRWRKEWGKYLEEDLEEDAIVDGGVLSNFPLDLVTSQALEITKLMAPITGDDVPKLGLLIDESRPVPGVEPAAATRTDLLGQVGKLRTVQRVRRLVDTMTDANDNFVIQEHESNICRLPAKGYGTTEFDLSDEKIERLVAAGREAMRSYFDSRIVRDKQPQKDVQVSLSP